MITPDIERLLNGETKVGVFPDYEAETLIGKFCARHLLTVSRKKTRARPDLEQIEGVKEVWALCPRRPPPGWRILGRWYHKDIFVALRAWPKGELFNKYEVASNEVISKWESIFDDRKPHTGFVVGDYLSQVYQDVDEPKK